MLRISQLAVRFGRVAALRGVSLTIDEGEVVGVVGPNGAGKTTLLGTIMGLFRPAKGSITFNGKSLVGLAPEEVVRRGLALVPEGRRIFGSLTVEENLIVGASSRPYDRDLRRDLDNMCDRFPALKTYWRGPAGKLSGGEQQQLAIARALLAKPKLLLLDEPSLGLSPMMVSRVFEILAELHKEGVTMLLVEQNVRRTLEFADRSYVFSNGLVGTAGSRDSLSGIERSILDAYLGAGAKE
jgi:branched-chain amino acid transport system ATP-binding protein